MRVVLDTNVLLSALISPRGAPHTLYTAWREAKFELVTSAHQLDELRRASRYPKFKAILQPAKIGTMINYLQHAIIVKPAPLTLELTDPHDLFLLELSAAGNADYLVTGDHRAGLLERRHFQRTRIVTPTAFCQDFL